MSARATFVAMPGDEAALEGCASSALDRHHVEQRRYGDDLIGFFRHRDLPHDEALARGEGRDHVDRLFRALLLIGAAQCLYGTWRGRLTAPKQRAYDKKVAGVISGAGDLKPPFDSDKQPQSTNRLPIALMGKVFCKVDAQYSAIEEGDLLTTSPTSGHAMKATDPAKRLAQSSGKQLKPLEKGTGFQSGVRTAWTAG